MLIAVMFVLMVSSYTLASHCLQRAIIVQKASYRIVLYRVNASKRGGGGGREGLCSSSIVELVRTERDQRRRRRLRHRSNPPQARRRLSTYRGEEVEISKGSAMRKSGRDNDGSESISSRTSLPLPYSYCVELARFTKPSKTSSTALRVGPCSAPKRWSVAKSRKPPSLRLERLAKTTTTQSWYAGGRGEGEQAERTSRAGAKARP